MKSNSYRIFLLAIVCLLYVNAPANPKSLSAERHGDHLHVSAPQVHFISGRAAEQLRNGSMVTYVLKLIVTPQYGREAVFVLQEKFAISFDLWEEKYSVVQKKPDGRSVTRLTSLAAEAWCLESMPVPVGSVPEHQPFMIKLECFIDEDDVKKNAESRSGLTLAAIIDAFSRKKPEETPRWEAAGGPFRLEHLKILK
jgi:hypothetical protein